MLPDKVIVGPYTYIVEQSLRSSEPVRGETESDQLILRVAPDLPPQRARAVLFHELLHACFDLIGNPLSDKVEEDVINRLAPVLLDVLERNPDLR